MDTNYANTPHPEIGGTPVIANLATTTTESVLLDIGAHGLNIPSDTEVIDSATDATISTEEMIELLEAAFCRSKAGIVERVEFDRELGRLFIKAKKDVIPKGNLTIEQWVATHLSFSHQYANRCADLAKKFDQFLPAHEWYRQAGIAAGVRTKKNTGVDYALEVIRLHKAAKSGVTTGGAASVARKPLVLSTRALEANLRAERAAFTELTTEFARVVNLYRELYRETDSGAD